MELWDLTLCVSITSLVKFPVRTDGNYPLEVKWEDTVKNWMYSISCTSSFYTVHPGADL